MNRLATRLPIRPVFKFLWLYVVKLGLLDEGPGLTYCVMQTMYEQMIVVRKRELGGMAKGLRL